MDKSLVTCFYDSRCIFEVLMMSYDPSGYSLKLGGYCWIPTTAEKCW